MPISPTKARPSFVGNLESSSLPPIRHSALAISRPLLLCSTTGSLTEASWPSPCASDLTDLNRAASTSLSTAPTSLERIERKLLARFGGGYQLGRYKDLVFYASWCNCISLTHHAPPHLTIPICERLRCADTILGPPSTLACPSLISLIDNAVQAIDSYYDQISDIECWIFLKPKLTTVRKGTLKPIEKLVYGLHRYDVGRRAALVDQSDPKMKGKTCRVREPEVQDPLCQYLRPHGIYPQHARRGYGHWRQTADTTRCPHKQILRRLQGDVDVVDARAESGLWVHQRAGFAEG
ncbi:hypothetical protein C8F01DRAFT_1255544 [Mycena amicta]|nr:hypothetical protein C8F01DRAFT_1255540 [Mycena amicta]KAJ7058393.1 hypothetical protein C8F01DRAFT_1255544 [Mycena amicta]